MAEKVIGTWIDGKPLYETIIKTYSSASKDGTTFGVTDFDVASFNFETIVDFKANLVVGDVESQYDATMTHLTHWPANLIVCFVLNTSQQIVQLRTTSTEWIDTPVYITVLYTKTTDTI